MVRGMQIGALFDWDGVIIDSSAQHEESWERLALEERRPLPADHFKRGFGMKNEVIIPDVLGWSVDAAELRRMSLRKEAIYREVVAERGIEPLAGVRTFLERLRAAGVPCAIASSTHRANIDLSLGRMGLEGCFARIVSAEDVAHGKPHPEPYEKAAQMLGCDPRRCVVFEDALMGIDSGLAAGAKVVAVTTTNPRDVLAASGAHRVVDRLDELHAVDLVTLVG
ncbi:beta-phosphoglucomutase family hydrolase [Opitutales bacterium ASA1]|nr:beta-phosphoglucomutase family hydrolase [Opitutales bacterium ASA1]